METQELKHIVEALIFAADEPLSADRIKETLEPENGCDLDLLIAELNREYQDDGRAFTIRKVAGGYQIVTQQHYANWIRKLYLGRQKNRLSHAALETLALIAFKQPISRVDIAQIRGVNSDGVIGTLLERKLITISGRSEGVGRPLLYSTTPEFLKYFGINDIADLPKPREIEELFSKEGMPEELLQALSQTDAQLSLPINADGETPISSEDNVSNATANNESELTRPAAETSSIIDINEKVATQFEDSDNIVPPPPSSPSAANQSENEIAWISLNHDMNNATEHVTGRELPVDELTQETVVADVEEVIEMAVASPAVEVQVVAAHDVGLPDVELPPPELETDSDEEIDGWLAEEFSQEEIAEPGFLKKAEDFFLEDLPQPSVEASATLALDENVSATDSEPIVVSTPELAAITDKIFPHLDETASEPETSGEARHDLGTETALAAPALSDFPELNNVEIKELAHSPAPSSEQPENITIVNFDEPTIIAAGAETTPRILDDTRAPSVSEEVSPSNSSDNLESVNLRQEIAEVPAPSFVNEIIVEREIALPFRTEESVVTESLESEITKLQSSDSSFAIQADVAEIISAQAAETSAPNEAWPVQTHELPKAASEEKHAATLRERLADWIKRTFDKLITLIGAKF